MIEEYTDEQLAEIYMHHEQFARMHYRINDENGNQVWFETRSLGARISEALRRYQDADHAAYLIAVKPRRAWSSAHWASEIHRRVAFQPGQRALIIAHIESTANDIFGFCREYEDSYRDLQKVWDPAYRTKRDRDAYSGPLRNYIKALDRENRGDDEFEYQWGGRIAIQTAKNATDATRGGRANFLLLSEAAFYGEHFSNFRRAAMSLVPRTKGNVAAMESTGNGRNGFYQMYMKAQRGGDIWTPIFVGTHEIERYKQKVRGPLDRFLESLSAEERRRQKLYNLTPEQVQWFRDVMASDFGDNIDLMRAEYPYEWEEAFVGTGRSYFDAAVLDDQPILEPAVVGDFKERENQGDLRPQVYVQPRRDGEGLVRLLRHPKPGQRFVIGADVATGKDTNNGKGVVDPDLSAAVVHDIETCAQFATLHGRMEPIRFAEQLFALGKFFNWAFLNVEANSYGLAVIGHLLDVLQWPRDRFYLRQNRRRDALGNGGMTALEHFGFLTTDTTRGSMLSKLQRNMHDGTWLVSDVRVLDEMQSFVVKANGRPEHDVNCHDDLVFASGIALETVEQAQTYFGTLQSVQSWELQQEQEVTGGSARWTKYRPSY